LQVLALNGVSLQGLLTSEALATIDLIAASPSGIQSVTLREVKVSLTPIQRRVAKLHAAHVFASAQRHNVCISVEDDVVPQQLQSTVKDHTGSLETNDSSRKLRRESSGGLLRIYKTRQCSFSEEKRNVMYL